MPLHPQRSSMTSSLAAILLLLVAAIVMFVLNRPRMDAVALIMMAAMPFTGVVTVNETLAGFADPNIVLIAALFVIGEGLVRTGVARRLGDWLNARAGSSPTRLLVLLMLVVGGLGSFMSSTAVVAIFIPVVLRICQNTGTPPRQLMMPLSVAALISGMMTLVATTPNLVVNAELMRQGAGGFHFFSFTPFGLPLLILGIGYMLFARRLLAGGPETAVARPRVSLRDWIDQYGLAEREYRVRVSPESPLIGKKLEELSLRDSGINILAIERGGRFSTEVLRPSAQTALQTYDVLLIDVVASHVEIDELRHRFHLRRMPLSDGAYFLDKSQEIGMVEAMLPPESPLIGQSILKARVRATYGLTVIGLRRGQKIFGQGLLEEKLKVGDTLLLIGFWGDIRELQRNASDLIVLTQPAEMQEVLPAAKRAPQAVLILALTVGLMVSGLVPNVHAALIGCLLMGLFRCVDMSSAYRSVSWKSLILIVGMLPFSLALQRTGGVDLAADAVLALTGNAAPRTVLAILFVITAVLGLFISNTATAVLMAPVALAVAKDLGASPYPFAMTVALAASAAFMTPISSPVNTLVVGPGNYTFGDFVKIGVPFTMVVMMVSLLLVPWLLPFR
ncbi:SLC13 family permease [Roseomonas gilardii]|uniref:SLC13 family permease n=1 Tax=Roseomonas gilardii TaxID=257708 RepID=A0ABU3MKS6_9PROT|nr:SLC13 family permease [Roseomonas gilardii]MDT8333583.1 SLC13 family permease [Roseomonas gilardii]